MSTVLIVDNSASVSRYQQEFVNVINSIIETERKLASDSRFSLITFNNDVTYCFINNIVKNIPVFDKNILKPEKETALYDSIIYILHELDGFFNVTNQKPIVIILTDGNDTTSKKFNQQHVALKIQMLKQKGWNFIFLGTEENSISLGKSFGCNINIRYELTEACFMKLISTIQDVLYSYNHVKDRDIDLSQITEKLNRISL